MRRQAAHRVHHGPLRVYVKPLPDPPELLGVVRALPPSMPVVWLDSARRHPVTGRWSLLGYDPWLTLRSRAGRAQLRTSAATRTWRAHPLDALRHVLRRYAPAPDARMTGHGRAVGLVGFLSYELNRWIEPRVQPLDAGPNPVERPLDEMVWFGMRVVILVDHLRGFGWLVSVVDPHEPEAVAHRAARAALERAEAALAHARWLGEWSERPWPGDATAPGGIPVLEATSRQSEFEAMVRKTLEYIRAGEIFQANVSQRFSTRWRRTPLSLYAALRRINPSPFACYLAFEGLAVVSCSPERLIRVQEGRIEARPIAGTRPRGSTPSDDAINSLELLLSEKERAEHIMLVDLARNDLGRVCRVGSIGVGELMTLEEYSHVIHIVSNVSGALRRGVGAAEIIRAVFPGGTITGCPKVRCMQLLAELEPVARGLYTGSLGYLGFDGTLDLNIAIRTMVLQGQRLSFHVGAGIVADSDPEREYHETLAKAGALTQALRVAGERTDLSHAAAG
jgi:anthranilate/para-aminobenzoate synthase component I